MLPPFLMIILGSPSTRAVYGVINTFTFAVPTDERGGEWLTLNEGDVLGAGLTAGGQAVIASKRHGCVTFCFVLALLLETNQTNHIAL